LPLVDAVRSAGAIALSDALQSQKKRYSELLSKYIAYEVAGGLRSVGFANVTPVRDGPGEKAFQGGLGPKRVDVSYADERHGLLLAVSVKTICTEPYGKNLRNRFSDLCTEAISLHMRFPYGVVTALFAMPEDADRDITAQRRTTTFRRAAMLLSTISGRREHSSDAEKFEDVTMMLFGPLREGVEEPWVRLYSAASGEQLGEDHYFRRLRDIFNVRNPHMQIGVDELKAEGEES
jgi:hypothetical protein